MNIHTGATHEVLNQARPATGWNAFSNDAVLQGVAARSAPWVADNAVALGALAGDAETQELARLANPQWAGASHA
jgi:putative acyl-CoA dehydrogenase